MLDRAAPELLAELADLPDLGLGEEDLSRGGAPALRWVPPTRVGGARSRCRPRRVGGAAQHLAAGQRSGARDPAGSRRGRRGGVLPRHRGGVDDAPERDEPAHGYTIDYDRAALAGARRRWCAWVATWSAPRPTSAAATGCARTAAPTGSAVDPMVVRCEAILAAAVRRGPWARRQLRRLWNGADAADRATIAAWVAAHDARIPPAPRDR